MYSPLGKYRSIIGLANRSRDVRVSLQEGENFVRRQLGNWTGKSNEEIRDDDGEEGNNKKIDDGIRESLLLSRVEKKADRYVSLIKLVNADNGEPSRMRKEWTMTGRKSGGVPAVGRHPEALL